MRKNPKSLLSLLTATSALLPFGTTALAANLAPSSFSVPVGTYSGGVKALGSAGEGSALKLYTNRLGNLQADFSFSASQASSLQVAWKQASARDSFTFLARNAAGAYVRLGASAGSKQAQTLRFPFGPAYFVNGKANVRIVASAGADDANLDALVLSDAKAPATPEPAPKPTPAPAPKPTPAPTTPAPAPTPVPAPSSPVSTAGVKLPPTGKVQWDWQIGAGGDASITVPAGAKLLDVDVFNTSKAKVQELKAQGLYMICYVNAGSYQPGYPDSAQYPAYLKLQADPDWKGEFFLDVRDVFKPNSELARILEARLQLCKDKGFDAVEPDNLQNDENIRGGLITTQEQIDFNGWFADAAHRHGLAVFQKNGPDKVLLKDRTGKMMVEKFDGILNEECQQYNECAPLTEYPKRGKLALNVEYKGTPNCTQSNNLQINTLLKDLSLKGGTMSGYKRVSCQ